MDEASIEDIVRAKGYSLGYVPDAIVTNHGPETMTEYFEQRRRIARGHYWLQFAFGYEVATLDRSLLLRNAIGAAKDEDAFGKVALAAAVGTEVAARVAGFWDARVVGGKHRTWTRCSRPSRSKVDAAARSTDRPRRLSARPTRPRQGSPHRSLQGGPRRDESCRSSLASPDIASPTPWVDLPSCPST